MGTNNNPLLDVELSCDDPNNNIPAQPNASTMFIIKIKNTGTLFDTYDVIAGSGEDLSCKVNGKNVYVVSLKPGESRTAIVTVEIWDKEPVSVRNYNIDVEAMSLTDTCIFDNLILTAKAINNDNHQPDPPEINGSKSGKVGEEYTYEISITDPDEDPLQLIIIDWGDGEIQTVEPPVEHDWPSGSTVIIDHSWDKLGLYTINAWIMDDEYWSKKGTLYDVSMPKDKPVIKFLNKFMLEKNPLVTRLFQYLSVFNNL